MTKKKEFKIAIACEFAPAKSLIPIIERLKELESYNELNWRKTNVIALSHGEGTEQILKSHVDEIYSIGKGRGGGESRKNNFKLSYLIFKDILKAVMALRGKNIDLLISCGNAGDVRKAIAAANFLGIPILHIEQDIYNPIELISFANIITTPSKKYEDYLKSSYGLKNVKNIGGYPMASYVHDYIANGYLKTKNEVFKECKIDETDFSDFILFVLGGDLKENDLNDLILAIQKIDFPVVIAPYRFKKEDIENLINASRNSNLHTFKSTESPINSTKSRENSNNSLSKIMVLDGFFDMLSLMNISKAIVYGAGMGMVIETGVLKIPSIKIAGFHKVHGSVDLANRLKIPILEMNEIPDKINNINSIDMPQGDIVKDSQIAIEKVVDTINNFDFRSKKSGFKSMKAIWKKRSEFR
jgi:UDP-N-acetylglucosamine:LPS N-acetylglucosamine transferase